MGFRLANARPTLNQSQTACALPWACVNKKKMARIEEKIAEIADPALRQIIGEEVAKLKKNTRFGLVFEEHQPEVVPIYGKRIKRGERVAKKTGNLSEIWRVLSVKDGLAVCEQEKGGKAMAETRSSFPTQQLVVIRSMGETIYPSLTPVDSVTNGDPSAPHHVLIEADNYHALQLLLFPYEGKVDCIYIDPPYNSGARDWKYNNDYVDRNDAWQHSKWLNFMDRRLRLAKRLLNPNESMLIVTIDEKEYLRLGLLLEQIFPECKIQMTTIVINPKGTARYNEFSRVEEYAFFVFVGGVRLQSSSSDMLTDRDYSSETHVRWRGLARTGRKGLRSNNPGSWYPIFLNASDFSIHSIGDAIGKDDDESDVLVPDGTIAVWPPCKDGNQYSWSTVSETLRSIHEKGGFKTGRINHEKSSYPFYYLSSGLFEKIAKGEILVTGRGPFNELIVEFADGLKSAAPRSVWNQVAHDAGSHGTSLLQQIIPGGKFPFPKSVYAVRDAIRFFTAHKPNALIVDFFAGSGTTLNAVNLLNSADDGRRQCILVSNNEVSEAEATSLAGRGFQPGQDEWDDHGICRSVTWRRNKFTILGKRDDGTPLNGDYQTGRTVTKEKARNIRQLGFVDGRNLSLTQRKQLASLMPALPQSKLEANAPWFLDEDLPVSVLWDIQQAEAWLEELADADHLTDIYVVTTENRLFTALSKVIKETLGPLIVDEGETLAMADGFAANLEYFRLDFLDPQEIQMGRQFSAILPILWMMAGSRGARPDAPNARAPWLLPDGCPFVVLMQETRFKEFVRHVESRADLTHVFIVTNSQDTVYKLRREWPQLRVVQLYKDYLENFRINLSEKPAQ
jgi:adenine-specific DNA-methyltransferase